MSDTSNCASSIASANTLASNWATVNPSGVDTDLAVARCPTKQDLCGSIKEFSISDKTRTPQTMTMSGSWTPNDSCSWVFRAECGAPAFTISGDVTDSDVEIFYMEYAASEVNLDGNWPAEKKADATAQTAGVPNYSNAKTINRAGELPYIKWFKTSSESYDVPASNIAAWIAAKQVEYDNFDVAATAFNEWTHRWDK